MSKTVLVLAGRNGLDSHELRQAVLRIPEVSRRVREAQSLLDATPDTTSMDLANYISSDDAVFDRNLLLKGLCAAVVQVGLFERHLKYQKIPDLIAGNSNGDSALAVVTHQISFEDLVKNSQALSTLRVGERILHVIPASATQLTGASLTEYQAVQLMLDSAGKKQFTVIERGYMEFQRLAGQLIEHFNVDHFINIGPAQSLITPDLRNLSAMEISVSDSIETDPLLSWFWRTLRPGTTTAAQ